MEGTRSQGEAERLTGGEQTLHPSWEHFKEEGVVKWCMVEGYSRCPFQFIDHLTTCCEPDTQ